MDLRKKSASRYGKEAQRRLSSRRVYSWTEVVAGDPIDERVVRIFGDELLLERMESRRDEVDEDLRRAISTGTLRGRKVS